MIDGTSARNWNQRDLSGHPVRFLHGHSRIVVLSMHEHEITWGFGCRHNDSRTMSGG